MSSWQLFLADSLAIDKVLQASVDTALELIDEKPLPPPSIMPSRLPLFVSLSLGSGAQETASTTNLKHDIDLGSSNTISKTSNGQSTKLNSQYPLKFKSILFTAATKGLRLYLISSYYHDQVHNETVHESSSSMSPSSSQGPSISPSIKRAIRRLQPFSSHLEVALRCQAVKVFLLILSISHHITTIIIDTIVILPTMKQV
jgi:hypothetical protein